MRAGAEVAQVAEVAEVALQRRGHAARGRGEAAERTMGRLTAAARAGGLESTALEIFQGEDKAARQEAYTELRALAGVQVGSDCTVVVVEGLGQGLEDEGPLTEAFSEKGYVLAATVHPEKKTQRAWVTYADAKDAQRAVASAPKQLLEGGGIVTLVDAAAMEEPYGEHLKNAQMKQVELAKACIAPLVHGVLCADVSRVDAAEARDAFLLLGELVHLDPVKVRMRTMHC